MSRTTILDWTKERVLLKFDDYHEVKYRVYREDRTHFLEVRHADDEPIRTLELPDGMKLDKSSYDVLLRYVLLDVAAA